MCVVNTVSVSRSLKRASVIASLINLESGNVEKT